MLILWASRFGQPSAALASGYPLHHLRGFRFAHPLRWFRYYPSRCRLRRRVSALRASSSKYASIWYLIPEPRSGDTRYQSREAAIPDTRAAKRRYQIPEPTKSAIPDTRADEVGDTRYQIPEPRSGDTRYQSRRSRRYQIPIYQNFNYI